MKIITSKGIEILVDKQDFERLSKLKWYVAKTGYAANDSLPRKLMHRFLMNNPKSYVDHINGNKLDNRRTNLRLCNQSGNSANSRLKSTNKSGYKGVCWAKREKRWSVYLTKDYKHIYGGLYADKVEAAKRYNELAIQLFGDFAKLNRI